MLNNCNENSESSRRQKRNTVSIGLIQTAVSDDVFFNMKKTAEKVEEAAKEGAQIVCLQELYRTKYFPQDEKRDALDLAETIPGASTKMFSELAKTHDIALVVPVFERTANGKYYNSAAVIDADGKYPGRLSKSACPKRPMFL